MNLLEDEQGKLDVLFTKLKTYCKPKQNMTIKRYRFNTCVQGRQENIDQYMTELRLIAKNCSFGDLEEQLIRDWLVCGTNSEEFCQKLLRVEELSLDKAISICRAHEESKKSAQYLRVNDKGSVEVNELKRKNGKQQKYHRKRKTPLTHPPDILPIIVAHSTPRDNVQLLESNTGNATS